MINRRKRHWFLNYLDECFEKKQLKSSFEYARNWFFVYLGVQIIGGRNNGLSTSDTLIFFGAFVGVPFLIFYGLGLYIAWKDRNIYRDEEGWNRYRDTNELVGRKERKK
tara:strand:+ start:728 stop:1054 length:327 start_codon:yes stop_codon:yes gene_type:complete